MRIDHAYKGVTEKTLVLFDDGMCDGPDLQVGEQYLMYTRRNGNGDVPSRGCSRSRHLRDATEDMQFLNGLSNASPFSTVFGRILDRTDDYYGNEQPLAGALVELKGIPGTHVTTTDGDGRYSFEHLEPAKYTVSADLQGFRMLTFGSSELPAAEVQPRGCAVVNMIMRRRWRGSIVGRLIRSNGEPGPDGLDLTLIRLENRNGKEESNYLFGHGSETDERGEYSFSEVTPGRYKIAMNVYSFPTEKAPYPTMYWPGVRTEGDAGIIEVKDEASQQRFDFRLPPEPKMTKVTGTVLGSDGKPASGVRVAITALPDNNISADDENRPQTDAYGHFSFIAIEGFDYSLSARQAGKTSWHSAELVYSGDKRQDSITLVLDRQGLFDNDPVKRVRDQRD